ncbi:helix-turn-helix domain-containing protein [Asaia bogorensis]|uniref:helix-turn-helix domain-containing protein n=1 Tax=Asaia bogorensis TaxID=91915 RepID=UPI003018D231
MTRPRAQEAIDVLTSRPVISAACLAADLEVSTTAAHGLLNRFVNEGLVREMTGLGTWRLYTLGGRQDL